MKKYRLRLNHRCKLLCYCYTVEIYYTVKHGTTTVTLVPQQHGKTSLHITTVVMATIEAAGASSMKSYVYTAISTAMSKLF